MHLGGTSESILRILRRPILDTMEFTVQITVSLNQVNTTFSVNTTYSVKAIQLFKSDYKTALYLDHISGLLHFLLYTYAHTICIPRKKEKKTLYK